MTEDTKADSEDESNEPKEDSDEDILEDALECYETFTQSQQKNVENWREDMRFARLGEKWPEAVKRQRDLDGRPCLTINKLPAFIRQVTNDARQNSPSIKYHPVSDDASKEVAKIMDGLTRNIEYSSNADIAYDTALDHAVTAGFGYFRIVTDYANDDVFDLDIKIEAIKNPLTVIKDAYSDAADSSDWTKCFVTEMMTKEQFNAKWPKAKAIDWKEDGVDKPEWFTDKEIRVCEYWVVTEEPAIIYQLEDGSVQSEEGYSKIREYYQMVGLPMPAIKAQRKTTTRKVMQYIISGVEVLETNKWPGKYIPIVPVYGDEVNIDGDRTLVSLIRFAKDSQSMFNYWRTASTELVALAPKTPFIGAVGSFDTDAAKWATANTVSHSYIEYDPVNGGAPPQRQPFAGPPAGALQESLNAADDMKSIMGIFDASLGAKSNETSGRAIMARQREGDVSTFNFIDNLSRAIRHAGRILCDLIPKVYNVERIVRIIHENGTNEHVQINKQFQVRSQEQNQPMPGQPMMQGQIKEGEQGHEGQEFQEAITKIYDLTIGKYDVTCETGPSYTTKREEAAGQMIEFIRAFPQSAPLLGDMMARNMDWPEADEIAERLKAMLPPQLHGNNPQLAQLQQQMQKMDGDARQTIGDLQHQLQQAQEDKSIEKFNAETARMKAMKEIQPVEQVQEVAHNTMSESEKLQFDADVKLALEDKKQKGAMELELLRQRGSLAAANTNDLVLHDENLNPIPNTSAIDSITQLVNHIGNLHKTISAPRVLIRDEMGKPVGSRIAESE